MEQTVRVFDQQYLLQTAADLLTRRAEIQNLRDSIRAAEASSVRGTSTALSGRTSPSRLWRRPRASSISLDPTGVAALYEKKQGKDLV